jgi:hypothetical protein
VLLAEVIEGPDHALDPVVELEEGVAKLREAGPGLDRSVAVGRGDGLAEVLGLERFVVPMPHGTRSPYDKVPNSTSVRDLRRDVSIAVEPHAPRMSVEDVSGATTGPIAAEIAESRPQTVAAPLRQLSRHGAAGGRSVYVERW